MADTIFESVQTTSILIHIRKQHSENTCLHLLRRQTFLLPPLFSGFPKRRILVRQDAVIALKYGDT
jgi:hypothetical protein